MMIKKITIKPGCIGCGLCESIAPTVFVVRDIARVKELHDYTHDEQKALEAERQCPMQIIQVDGQE